MGILAERLLELAKKAEGRLKEDETASLVDAMRALAMMLVELEDGARVEAQRPDLEYVVRWVPGSELVAKEGRKLEGPFGAGWVLSKAVEAGSGLSMIWCRESPADEEPTGQAVAAKRAGLWKAIADELGLGSGMEESSEEIRTELSKAAVFVLKTNAILSTVRESAKKSLQSGRAALGNSNRKPKEG